MQEQQQNQQDDIINDPNMMLAIAMVKSISALKDNQGAKSQSESGMEESSPDPKNLVDIAKFQKIAEQQIEVNPIMDFIDKLEFKKQLSVVLEVLSRKETTSANLFNDWIPIILKIITCLSSHTGFNQCYSRYMKHYRLDINEQHLTQLNQYLVDLLPNLYKGSSKQKQQQNQKDSDIVMVQRNVPFQEDDSLEKLLEYVPQDYQTLANLLKENQEEQNQSEQLPSLQKEESKKQEEDKDDKDVYQTWKELIQNIKIVETYGKALDKLAQVANTTEGLLELETNLIVKVFKSIESLNIKSKLMTLFVSNDIENKAIKTMQNISKSLVTQESKMDIDSQGLVAEVEGQLKQVLKNNQNENINILAKTTDILLSVYNNIQGEKLKSKVIKTFEEIINMGDNFNFLVQIKGDQETQRSIFSLIKTITSYIFMMIKNFDAKKIKDKTLQTYFTTISVFLNFSTNMEKNYEVLTGLEVKPQEKQEEVQQPLTQSQVSSVRTRGQTKKEKISTKKADVPSRQQAKKNDPPLSQTSQTSKRNASQVSQASQKSQQNEPSVKQQTSKAWVQDKSLSYIQDEILKTCISNFVMIQNLYLKQEINMKNFNELLLNNIINFSIKAPAHIKGFTQGILSQFVNIKVNYASDAQDFIVEHLLQNMFKVQSSKLLVELFIKLLILFKRQDLNEKVGLSLIQSLLQGHETETKIVPLQIKTYSDLFSQKQFSKYMIFLSTIINSDDNVKQNLSNQIMDVIFNQNTSLSLIIGQLHMLTVCLLKDEILKKLKSLVFAYVTKSINDKADVYVEFQSELDKIYSGIMNYDKNSQDIFNNQALENFQNKLQILEIVNQLRKVLASPKTLEQKPQVIPILKQLCLFNKELSSVNEKSKVFIGVEPNVNIFKLLLKDFLQNNVDVQAKLLISSKLDKDIQYLGKQVYTKVTSKQQLGEEEQHIIQNLFEALNQISSLYSSMQSGIVQEYLNKETVPNQNDTLYQFILSSINLDLSTSQIITKIQANLQIQKIDDKNQINTVFDPLSFSKMLTNLGSSTLEESIFSHCLFNSSHIEMQYFFSVSLLLKQLYNNLTAIMVNNTEEMSKENKKIVKFLLNLRYNHKFLEHLDGQNSTDNESLSKLLKKQLNDQITFKEFLSLRSFDKVLNLINIGQKYLESNQIDNANTKKLLINIVNDAIIQLPAQLAKTQKEYQILSTYFFCNEASNDLSLQLMKLFKRCDGQTVDLIWNLFTFEHFSQEVDLGEQKQTKKGGLSLVINFQSKNGKKFKKQEADQEMEIQDLEQNKHVKEFRNTVIDKLLQTVIDIIQPNEQGKEFSEQLSQLFKRTLPNQKEFKNLLIYGLQFQQQLPHIKKLIRIILEEKDEQQKDVVQKYFETQLVNTLQSEALNDDCILEILQISQIIFQSNNQLIQFIKDNLINRNYVNNTTKYLLIDFLFQLATSQFSQNNKYSEKLIKELRQKKYEEKEISQQKKIQQHKLEQQQLIKESQNDSQKNPLQDGLDGYKDEVFIKDNSNFAEYMEKPEEVCTFSRTRKDFIQQHWYFCYTCGLTDSNGCCAVCARRCHKNHQVVYSKKSNFFCDCGEGGKCQSLQPEADKSKEKLAKSSASKPFTGIFQNQAEDQKKENIFQMKNIDFIESYHPPLGNPFLQSASAAAHQLPKMINPFTTTFKQGNNNNFQHKDENLLFQRYKGHFPPPEEIFSDSSDEEIMRESEDFVDIGRGFRIPPQLKNFNGLMKMFKEQKQKEESKDVVAQKLEQESSSSQLTNINPLENPISEDGDSIMQSQSFATERKDSFQQIQSSQESQVQEDLKKLSELINSEKQLFEEIFQQTLEKLDKYLNQIKDSQESESVLSSPRKRDSKIQNFITTQKIQNFTTDLAQVKKSIQGVFKNKISEEEDVKRVCQLNLNLLNQVDNTQSGLVAVGEKQEVKFYASATFFEEQQLIGHEQAQDLFKFQKQEGTNLYQVESHKLGFQPLSLKFNPKNQNFLAICGIKNLEVLTLNSKGKIISQLSVDLLLEAFGKDLTIVNINWLPDSQTMIAVATRQFVKIYDLAEDNISPKFNIMLYDDDITDFTFTKPEFIQGNLNNSITNILVSSKNGFIYTEEISYSADGFQKKQADDEQSSLMNIDSRDNSQIILSNILKFQLNIPIGVPCVSISYSNTLDSIIFSYDGGNTYISKVDFKNLHKENIGISIDNVEDKSSNNLLKTIWNKNGENLVNFKEIGKVQTKQGGMPQIYFLAFSRKLGTNNSLPVLIRANESYIDINILKHFSASSSVQQYPPVNGIIYVRNSFRSSKVSRLISLYEDGSAQVYNVASLTHVNQEEVSKQQYKEQKHFSINIQKGELPIEVKMPINFFEKMINCITDDIKSKISVTGEIPNLFKNKQVLEILAKHTASSPQIQDPSKKSLKMNLKMTGNEYVITGLRIRVDPNSKNNSTSALKLFNRIVKFAKNKAVIFTDIPFCDSEAIYGQLNGIDIEFTTDDVKNAPIRIYCVEVYVQTKKEFQYKEKIKALEKQNENQKQSAQKPSEKITNEQLIIKEQKKSTGIPLLTWEEKYTLFKENSAKDNQLNEMIILMNILAQVFQLELNNIQYNIDTLKDLKQKLIEIFRQQVSSSEHSSKFILAATKRCLKYLIDFLKANQIENNNFSQIEQTLFIESFQQKVQSNELDFENIKNLINKLSKIYQRSPIYFLQNLQQHPDLIQTICAQYLKLFKQDESLQNDIYKIVTLIISQYIQEANQLINSTSGFEGQTIIQLIDVVYQSKNLGNAFQLLQPFLLHQNEKIQKVTYAKLLFLNRKYSKAMLKILANNMLPLSIQNEPIILIDFAPHLLQFFFTNLIPYSSNLHDVVFSLSYKLIKQVEIIYQHSIDLDIGNYISEPLTYFIGSVLTSFDPSKKYYDQKEHKTAQQLYINLVLSNIILQHPEKDTEISIKESNLSINEILRENIIKQISSQHDNNLIQWAQNILSTYLTGFKEGQCSFRTKIEDGLAIQTYEEKNSQNKKGICMNLLIPAQEQSPWKWHPLFTNINGMFDFLDRKIPSQILLLIKFLISDFEAQKTQLLNVVCEISQAKPSSKFLKGLGDSVIKDIMIKNAQYSFNDQLTEQQWSVVHKDILQVKAQLKFEQFIDDLETLYQKFISRNISLSFNMKFHLHKIASKIWQKVASQISTWKQFVISLSQKKLTFLYEILINSCYYLNEETSIIFLSLAAIGLESESETSLVKYSFDILKTEAVVDLFSMFNTEISELDNSKKYDLQYVPQNINIEKLINVLLLGRNKKTIRVMASHLIKNLYIGEKKLGFSDTENQVINKLSQIQNFGINSLEYLAVLSFIVNMNTHLNENNDDNSQQKALVEQIYYLVSTTNIALNSHPNLEIYSTLQKLCPQFQLDQQKIFDLKKKSSKDEAKSPLFEKLLSEYRQKRSGVNPYILEIEACQKCYEQKSQPFTMMKLNDIKSENKFTDSCILMKFASTFIFKTITVNIHEMKGARAIKLINVYVNNKQGVELAEMRNNWSYWKRVQQVQVEIGKKLIDINFTLPVHATNLLVEFQTVILSKPIQQIVSSAQPKLKNCEGVDTVLQLLNSSTVKYFVSDNSQENNNEIQSGLQIDKESLICPRCSKPVQGKSGVCVSCGENAMQCSFCRNINYEKLDAFLCNECGLSRFAKFEFTFMAKQGFATEKIENEEMKTNALQQIEANLQAAQSNYTLLMKKRSIIQVMVKRLNEGNENINGKHVQDLYNEDCGNYYQAMMKSLNVIKILKQEIYDFQNQNVKQNVSENIQNVTRSRALSTDVVIQDNLESNQCFSCTQELLKSTLNFLDKTSLSLLPLYQTGNFIDLLYQQNLKMHNQSLQVPARKALCSIIISEPQLLSKFLKQMQQNLFDKKKTIPSYQLSQNLLQETQLLLDLFDKSFIQLNSKEIIQLYFWETLFISMEQNQENAAIAEQITGQILSKIEDYLKFQRTNDLKIEESLVQQKENIKQELFDLICLSIEDPSNEQLPQKLSTKFQQINAKGVWLLQSLVVKSSLKVREHAKDIIQILFQQKQSLQKVILKEILNLIDNALNLEGAQCDQYFDILQYILSQKKAVEATQQNQEEAMQIDEQEEMQLQKTKSALQVQNIKENDDILIITFKTLFQKVDKELSKLVQIELQKEEMGSEGFMLSICTGQALSRLVTIISTMIKEADYLKQILKSSVFLVIKCFLKIRKLNLTKNKIVQNCEIEIEKMFKELHSEKDEEKEKFIIECLTIIESGSCDLQEQRFLFEEICRVVCPAKPDPIYYLNLNKAQTQEFFIRGKMSKNPYPSKSLGQTMGDVREKICKELDLAEPELIELLVGTKIVATSLNISSTYEQVWWPYLCRQRNPDEYDIPNIEEADKASLAPMNVTYRLAGIDGEAQEDRVESLNESEDDDTSQNEKKFQVTKALIQPFQSKYSNSQINGIQVILHLIEHLGSLQTQKYLAQQIFRLLQYAIKIKENRIEILKNKQTISLLAGRLFESVGLAQQQETNVNKQSQTLFDQILLILENLVMEVNQQQINTNDMEIDSVQVNENPEAATHVELFIQIMEESCSEMLSNHQAIEKTSRKIKALSKILPFLINKEDKTAIQVIEDFIINSLTNFFKLDNPTSSQSEDGWTVQEKFRTQFNIERVIEILESTPISKNFLKDGILQTKDILQNICNYLNTVSLQQIDNENDVQKYKLANKYILRVLLGLLKNHPQSQIFLNHNNLLLKLYNLSQAKYKDKTLTILAQDIVESLTNTNYMNDEQCKSYLKGIIDQSNDEKKRLALKKKEEIMKMMQQKKKANPFIKKIEQGSVQDEQGPKCIICQEGYGRKNNEILGMYVFNKKLKIPEMSPTGTGFTFTLGYTTVTHSNFIHLQCHQNAYRADSNLRQPKKEWEGAIIRNDHTKCNNLFPLKGGKVPEDIYQNTVDKYFTIAHKQIGQSDSDKVKVAMHDLKSLLKRFAYEESFSRDSQGGGPEHNMHLIPFQMQMIYYLLQINFAKFKSQSKEVCYQQEEDLASFLDQGLQFKSKFMEGLEEEKKMEDFEEEEKFSEDQSSEGGADQSHNIQSHEESQIEVISLDALVLQLTTALLFSQLSKWEVQKQKFLSVILFSLSKLKDTSSEQSAKVLNISSSISSQEEDLSKRKRGLSDNKIIQVQRALQRVRPLLILMKLIDSVKLRWDGKQLGLHTSREEGQDQSELKTDVYIKRLMERILAKDSLVDLISDCDELFKEYKEKILKIGSVEEFLQDMGMLQRVIQDHETVENYILKHF